MTAAAGAVPPPAPDATPVAVQAGQTTSDIDGTLEPHTEAAGSVTGTLKNAPSGGSPVNTFVYLVTPSGKRVNHEVIRNDDGSFALSAPPSTTGYALCVTHPNRRWTKTVVYSQCMGGVIWSGKAPPSATPVIAVAAGHTVQLGEVPLRAGSSIYGQIKSADGKHVGTNVWAQSLSHPNLPPVIVQSGRYPHAGYLLYGLAPSPKGWIVCAEGGGYVGMCTGGKTWEGGPLPTDATPVHVAAGGTRRHVSEVLPDAGAITGTIVAQGSNRPLHDTFVTVFDTAGREVSGGWFHGKRYYAGGLAGGQYYLCASARYERDHGKHSYFGTCFHGQTWDEGQPPSGDTVSVTRGAITSDIRLALPRAGSIEGLVTNADGTPATNASVYLYDPAGKLLEVRKTGVVKHPGVYRLPWLMPATSDNGYFVCAADTVSGPNCYGSQAWDGPSTPLPPDAQTVPVQGSQQTGNTDFSLTPGGSISGTVTDATTGNDVGDLVYLFDADGQLLQQASPQYKTRDREFRYAFHGVPVGPDYRVCFGAGSTRSAPDHPRTIYAPECYRDSAWSA